MAANPNQVQAQRVASAQQRKLQEEAAIQMAVEENFRANARANRLNPQQQQREDLKSQLEATLASYKSAQVLAANRKWEEENFQKILRASESLSLLPKEDADFLKAIKESEKLAKAEQEAEQALEKAALEAYAQTTNANDVIPQSVASAAQVKPGPNCDTKHLADTTGNSAVNSASAASAAAEVVSNGSSAGSNPMLNQFQLRKVQEEARKSAAARKTAAAVASAAVMTNKKMVIKKGVITWV